VWALSSLLGGALVVHAARIALRDAWRRWRLRARMRRAAAGERDAARLLERAGYRVRGHQVRASLEYRLDAEPCVVDVSADYVVEKDGREWVAEVKTGREATRLTSRATRRQLLEYAHAFGAAGVLLVDAERGRVHRVTLPSRHAERPVLRDLALVALGAALGALAALVHAHAL